MTLIKLMTLLMILSVMLLFMISVIYADGTTFFCKCDQASDLWQQLELTSELHSDLRDTVKMGKEVTT